MCKKVLFGFLLSLAFFFQPLSVPAQEIGAETASADSTGLDFYLLTCSPGNELYSLFGHTALRMTVEGQGDMVFNYGTFDFNTSNFYFKFIRAILPYTLSISSYNGFVASYEYNRRSVYSQHLNLSPEAKQRLALLLRENYRPENRTYMYNFLYDNCSSRVRDIVLSAVEDSICIQEKPMGASLVNRFPVEGKSFWSMLDEYMEGYDWIHWGIHTILGYPATEQVNRTSAMFLPDYLMDGFASMAYADGTPLADEPEVIYRSDLENRPTPFYLSPLFVFSIVTLLILCVYFVFNIRSRRLKAGIAVSFFVLTGLVGLLLLFLGTCTYHPTVAPNFNMIWANPLNFIVPFLLLSRSRKVAVFLRYYLYCSMILVCLAVLGWYFLTPSVSMASIPLMLLMVMSHKVLITYIKEKKILCR